MDHHDKLKELSVDTVFRISNKIIDFTELISFDGAITVDQLKQISSPAETINLSIFELPSEQQMVQLLIEQNQIEPDSGDNGDSDYYEELEY